MFAWEQRKLGEIVEWSKGSGLSKDALNIQGIGVPVIHYADLYKFNSVQKEVIHWTMNDIGTKIPENNLLFPMSDVTPDGMARTSTVLQSNVKAGVDVLIAKLNKNILSTFMSYQINRNKNQILPLVTGTTVRHINSKSLSTLKVTVPGKNEQKYVGSILMRFDSLIALHQRKPFIKNGGIKMITSNFTCDSLFKDYFEFWIKLYKEGAVRPVTLEKYRNNQKHIAKIIPNLKMKDFDRNAYQELLNQYALTHERQTVIDFHHQVKGAILDAVDDGLIDRDPTRKAIFKGKAPREKKQKYLNQFELHNLLEDLDLGMEITWDWLILLIAKTGLRFSEALGLTPADFDFARQTISVNKTWDYKTNTGFQPTKNRSSIRKVQMDWQLGMQFQHLIKNLNEDEPIFVNGPVCNSTPNNCLARHCRKCGIPEISIHGLRHTHASLLMFAGVSIASVSRRLGHSSITTTQKVYMHIINELENQDNDLVMRYLSSLS